MDRFVEYERKYREISYGIPHSLWEALSLLRCFLNRIVKDPVENRLGIRSVGKNEFNNDGV